MTENTQAPPVPEHYAKAVAAVDKALNDRGIKISPCGVCHEESSFLLTDGFVVAPLSPMAIPMLPTGPNMPLISIYCSKCGNTVFMSSIVLGLPPHLFKKTEVPNGGAK